MRPAVPRAAALQAVVLQAVVLRAAVAFWAAAAAAVFWAAAAAVFWAVVVAEASCDPSQHQPGRQFKRPFSAAICGAPTQVGAPVSQ
jgi:hypothetical protein